VGILAAIVPCGILAGLYLATEEIGFIVACFALAVLAVAIIFMRHAPLSLRRMRGGTATRSGGVAGSRKLQAMRSSLGRTFTRPVLKILGFAVWVLAWGVTAALYARVANNAQIGGLVMLVLFGGFSPLLIYFGLESGVKRLTGKIRDGE
jgi:hypothetical protein